MKVKCKANPYNTLTIGEIYTVYAMTLFKDGHLQMLLIDDSGKSNSYDVELFEITDSKLPDDWYVNLGEQEGLNGIAVWGYEKYVKEPAHVIGLIERETEDLRYLYFEVQKKYKQQEADEALWRGEET